jgi:uncharacterized repeat protein (TIGR01451 family)
MSTKSRGTTVALLSVCALLLGASMASAANPYARLTGPPTPPQKGHDDPTTPGIGPQATGGPDGFGYTYIDSNEAGGPNFSFVDISGSGTPTFLGDDTEASVPIGFSFSFYGGSFSNVFLVSNGFLSFPGGSSGAFTNDCPFGGGSPANTIDPYWDDLDPGDDGAAVYTQTFAPGACPHVATGVTPGAGCFIADYEEFDHFPGDGVPGGNIGTFEVLLYTDGSILFQYEAGHPNMNGSSATVGINSDGVGNSLQYSCNTSTLAGGLAILFQLGAVGDLAITKTGQVVLGGTTTYTLQVTNNGPDDQTGVVVTDTIPASMTFVGDNCGGSFASPTWTWNIGNLANGASVSCDLQTALQGPDCLAVSNTATVTGDLADPSGNSSSTAVNGGGNIVADPSFEAGTPNPIWTEASTNFGTPLCTVALCGTGTGTGPRTGLWWSWFGGIAAFEDGSVSQGLTIPTGTTDLTFWLEAIVCASPADFIEVNIDGNQVFVADGSAAFCGVLGYHQETVDISAFADGGIHTLEFHSTTFGSGNTNFFVDDIEIQSAPMCIGGGGGGVPAQEIPTLDWVGLALLALVLAAGGLYLVRRRKATA